MRGGSRLLHNTVGMPCILFGQSWQDFVILTFFFIFFTYSVIILTWLALCWGGGVSNSRKQTTCESFNDIQEVWERKWWRMWKKHIHSFKVPLCHEPYSRVSVDEIWDMKIGSLFFGCLSKTCMTCIYVMSMYAWIILGICLFDS